MGQNVFVAGYSEFQLGTGSKANVPTTNVKNRNAIYEYQYGGIGNSTDGKFKGTDCSNLVWRSLKDAGYKVPDSILDQRGNRTFSTHTLFEGDAKTQYAITNFDVTSKTDTLAKNGNLQIGDIIMFRSLKSSIDSKGNTVWGQHAGIFFGYDAAGDPLFYGSQTSTGPAIANMTLGSTWNGKSFEVVGALRPKASFYDPAKDTTLPTTGTPQSSQSFIDGVKSDAHLWNDKFVTQIQQEFNQLVQGAKDAVAVAGQIPADIQGAITQALDQLAQSTNNALNQIDRSVMDVRGEAQNAISALENQLAQIGNTLGQEFLNSSQALEQWVMEQGQQLSGLTDYMGAMFSSAMDNIYSLIDSSVSNSLSTIFTAAQRFIPKKDPLILDLNGNGIETVAPNLANPILFDHEGNGIKTGTGWIAPSDGFLVLDRNGNGTIDDGTELFGDNTPIYAADGTVSGKAADGFDALAQQDTNADGVVNSSDANFANLRVWQDLNQDGISDAGELKTLDQLGIASINVGKTENSRILPNGNEIADLGTFVRTDGTTGSAGVSSRMADVNLAADTFHRSFTDVIPTTVDTATLPDMQGSGIVRDLREAASIQTPEGATLATALGQFATSTTRNEQRAQLDALLADWAATANYTDAAQEAAAHGYTYTTNLSAEWQQKLQLLEVFNGRGFYNMPWDTINAQGGVTGMSVTGSHISINMNGTQLALLDQAYSALKESVYDALLPQTRLKPYLDDIGLTLDASGNFSLDFAALDTRLGATHTGNANTAIGDLLDLRRLMGDTLEGASWDGLALLTDWAATDAGDAAVAATLADFGYNGGIHTNATGTVDGGNANDIVAGQGMDDALTGGAGNDMLLGGAGNDILAGGFGNDLLHGGAGNDTYVFNAGDGADNILETHGNTGIDTLHFGAGTALQNQLPITVGDINIAIEGDALVFRHINGRDSVTVAHWFASDSNKLDTITFADGRTFDLTTLQLGTINPDVLTALATTPGGVPLNQILAGGAGDDTLTGGDGSDWLLGGTGADTLSGGAGNDTYSVDNAADVVTENADEGVDVVEASVNYTLTDNVENLTLVGAGAIAGTGNALDNLITGNAADNLLQGLDGNDTLTGNASNDTLDGGAGADVMAGGAGNDTYVVDTLADTVTELAGQGTDTVKTDLTYTLGSNLENLTLTGTNAVDGTGNELNNVLTGNSANNTLSGLAGNDTLDGGLGADTLLGGTGDDTYIVESTGDLVIENAAEGTDTVKSSITYTLTDNVENLTLTGTANLDGTGNVLDNLITGNDAANTLTGLEGNDTLDGKGGADTLLGGTGNDTYVVDNGGDVVTENAGEGSDTVQSAINYTLGDNVENLTLTGSAITGTGNALDNVIIGNGQSNILDGGIGADSMAGGGGNDTYLLDNLGDTVNESAWQGTDTVIAPFNYTLGANVENLTLTESAALTGTGNELDNVITGNSNDNTLTGLAGNDTLDGGADAMAGGTGNDAYVVDTLADNVTEQAGYDWMIEMNVAASANDTYWRIAA